MNLIDRVKKILVTPKTEWEAVALETPDASKTIMGYVLPLAIVAAVAAFIGLGLIGIKILFMRVASVELGLYAAISLLLLLVLTILITAFIIDAVAPSFGSEKNFGRSVQLLAYGCTPLYLGAIASILPNILDIFLIIGGLFGAYLIFLGVTPLKKTPQDKQAVYAIICIGATTGVFFLVQLILKKIFAQFSGFGGASMNLDF